MRSFLSRHAVLARTRETDGLELFDDRYQGELESMGAYFDYLLTEMGTSRVISEVPPWLQSCLDLDVTDFASDMENGGDVTTIERPKRRRASIRCLRALIT